MARRSKGKERKGDYVSIRAADLVDQPLGARRVEVKCSLCGQPRMALCRLGQIVHSDGTTIICPLWKEHLASRDRST